ncbi:MAG: hypothetical protein JWR32_3375 [Mycobacterium sp.]|nr:hypothetical protein [Mycobacterium sp.]
MAGLHAYTLEDLILEGVELFRDIEELCVRGGRDRLVGWGDRTIAEANAHGRGDIAASTQALVQHLEKTLPGNRAA